VVKYMPLIWSGLRHRLSRTAFMLVQVAVTFTLFGVLQGLNAGIKQAIAHSHADRLYVVSRFNMGEPFPSATGVKIAALPGVVSVNARTRLRGYFQLPTHMVESVVTDPAAFFAIHDEIRVSPQALQRMREMPSGAIVGEDLARRYGWHVGERVPVQSTLAREDGTQTWTFDLVGTYEEPDDPQLATLLVANYSYVNEARQSERDTVNSFVVRIADPSRSADIAYQIDSLFTNSQFPTRSQSESEMTRTQMQRIGDLDFVTRTITTAAIFALLTATAALLMQSVRERTPELSTLKAMGFTDGILAALILSESLALCCAGAAIGLVAARLLLPYARNLIGRGSIHFTTDLLAVALAVGVALIAGALPTWRVHRLSICEGLAPR